MLNLSTIKTLGNFDVNFDLEPCDLQPEVFTSGNNFIIRNGKIATFNGNSLISTLPTNFSGGQVLGVVSGGAQYYLVMGSNKVYVFDGTTWFNITPVSFPAPVAGDEFLWTVTMLGNIPILNNPNYGLYYWSPQSTSQKLILLEFSAGVTWTSKGFYPKVVRSHRNFLFALNLTESAIELPNSYRWSHPADNNGLPYTWDTLDLGAIAGDASILGETGVIIDGQSLRDSFCIYTVHGITILDYIGGAYVWQARQLSSTAGLLTINCIANIFTAHVFLSDGDILINDGNSIRSLLHHKLKTRLNGVIDPDNYHKAFCQVNDKSKEVWFFIPTLGSTYPNLVIIYNWQDDKISLRDIDKSFGNASYGQIAYIPSTWSSQTSTWDGNTTVWSEGATSPFNSSIVGVNHADSALYALEVNDHSADTGTYVERLSLVIGDQRNVSTIIRAYPHMTSTGSVTFQFGSQDYVGGPIRWVAPVSFDPQTQRKVDFRTTGKLHSYRISSTGATEFTLSGMDLEFANNGVR